VQALSATDSVSDSFSVNVSDGNSTTPTQALSFDITGANDTPTSSPIPDVTVNQDVAMDALDVTTYFDDVDAGDTLTYTATSPQGTMPLTNGILPSITFANADVGVHNVTITATDSNNASKAESFTITVNNVNDAAIITALDGAITEGVATVSGTATHTDVDTDNTDNTFQEVTDVATTYGKYSVDAQGAWTYTLDNNNTTIDATTQPSML